MAQNNGEKADAPQEGYQKGEYVFITYKPSINKIYNELQTVDLTSNNVLREKEDCVRRIFHEVTGIYDILVNNHFISQMECGKGGNFHSHTVVKIRDKIEMDLFMCVLRAQTTKLEIDFRKVTDLEGVQDYIEKQKHIYPRKTYPRILKKFFN